MHAAYGRKGDGSLDFIFGILGVLCLVYYGIIVLYSGFGTSFSPVWIVLAVCFFLMAAVCHFYWRFRERIPLKVEVSVITVVAALFFVFAVVEAAMGCCVLFGRAYSTDYVIVLGAQVRGSVASRSMQYRLDKALEYARANPNTVMILSGGQGPGEDISEAEMMYGYLLENGVPEHQMIKETQSHSTYENLVYSRLLIEERESARLSAVRRIMAEEGYQMPDDAGMTIGVGVITNNFHLLRAEGIASRVGFTNVSGIAAKSDPVLFLHFCVRECFAILKDKFVGNM